MLKFGIRPHHWIADETPFSDIVEWVVRAEDKGFDSVHVGDRLLSRVPPVYESTMYEATTALAVFAAHTKRVQLSPLALSSSYPYCQSIRVLGPHVEGSRRIRCRHRMERA